MLLRTKILLHGIALLILLLIAGAAGFCMRATSDPVQAAQALSALATRQAATELGTALADQRLAVERAMLGAEPEHAGAHMAFASPAWEPAWEHALAGIERSELVAAAAKASLRELALRLVRDRNAALQAHARAVDTNARLLEHTRTFQPLCAELHASAGCAMRDLAGQLGAGSTGSSEFAQHWEAADSSMHNHLALLSQLQAIGKLAAGGDANEVNDCITHSLAEQRRAAARLLATAAFDVPLPALPGRITLRDLFDHELDTHARLLQQYIAAVRAMRTEHAAYTAAAGPLADLVSRIAKAVPALPQLHQPRSNRGELLATMVVALLLALGLAVRLVRLLQQRLSTLGCRLQAIADDGVLGSRLSLPGNDELATAAAAFDLFLGRLDQTVGDALTAVRELDAATDIARRRADALSHETGERAASLREVAATLQQVVAASNSAAEQATAASTHGEGATCSARDGARKTQLLLAALAQCKLGHADLAEALRLVDDVAFQTHLCAVNAAVQAAHANDAGGAGEAADGFAAVADNLRRLAQRATASLENTAQRLAVAAECNDRGGDLAQQLAADLEAFGGAAAHRDAVLAQIGSASQQQGTGIQQIRDSLAKIDDAVHGNEATAAALGNAISGSCEQVQRLRALLSGCQDSAANHAAS